MSAQPDTNAIPQIMAADVVEHGRDVGAPLDSPYEHTFQEAMERIAVLHQGWVEAVAQFGAGHAESDPELVVTEAAAA